MKSPWLWIIGLILAVLFFSENKKESHITPTLNESYVPQSQPETVIPSYSNSTFSGYPCTDDCSGHEAGYNWAEEHDIDDPDNCDGNSNSFIEGCQAYAEEQQGTDQISEE